jgi:hypothetical protein
MIESNWVTIEMTEGTMRISIAGSAYFLEATSPERRFNFLSAV